MSVQLLNMLNAVHGHLALHCDALLSLAYHLERRGQCDEEVAELMLLHAALVSEVVVRLPRPVPFLGARSMKRRQNPQPPETGPEVPS